MLEKWEGASQRKHIPGRPSSFAYASGCIPRKRLRLRHTANANITAQINASTAMTPPTIAPTGTDDADADDGDGVELVVGEPDVVALDVDVSDSGEEADVGKGSDVVVVLYSTQSSTKPSSP